MLFQGVSFDLVKQISYRRFMSDIELLTQKQVVELCGISRQTVWRLQKSGDFPAALQLSKRRVGYVRHQVEEWLASKSSNMDIPSCDDLSLTLALVEYKTFSTLADRLNINIDDDANRDALHKIATQAVISATDLSDVAVKD